MSYQYQVFLSYRRLGPVEVWVRDFFRKEFEDWLTEELGGEPARVFLDQTDLRPGDQFEAKLGQTLSTSCCLVPIWTPSYFKSSWCWAEWQTFRKRAQLARTPNVNLVVPIRWCDGDHFPAEAKNTQWEDFNEFAMTGPAFRSTVGFLDFQKKVHSFAAKVAAEIDKAPAADEWPVVTPKEIEDSGVMGPPNKPMPLPSFATKV